GPRGLGAARRARYAAARPRGARGRARRRRGRRGRVGEAADRGRRDLAADRRARPRAPAPAGSGRRARERRAPRGRARHAVAGAAAAWAKLPTAAAATWLQTVVHDLVRLRQLGPDAALVNDDLKRDLQSVAQRLDWRSLHRHLDELGRLRALADAPLVPQLQWEGVMVAWAERLEAAPLNR